METSTPSGLHAYSVAERFRSCNGDARERYRLCRLLWKELVAQIPCLEYSTPGQVATEHNKFVTLHGNPDPCAALEDKLVRQGLPDCQATRRLARPVIWCATRHHVLEPHVYITSSSIWVFSPKRYEAFRKHDEAGLREYGQYFLAHLNQALHQNL